MDYKLTRYRGKTVNGEWVYGSLFHGETEEGNEACIIFTNPIITTASDGDNGKEGIAFDINELAVVRANSVGVYIGMTDLYNRPVYVWDIVQEKGGRKYLVVWDAKRFAFMVVNYDIFKGSKHQKWVGREIADDDFYYFEVVGNLIDEMDNEACED